VTSPSSSRAWPALSEHKWLRLVTFTLFYLCQGFPIGLSQIAFPAWLTAQGLDLADVASFTAIVTLPWAFKLVAGPFMDRLAFPAMGLRRPWVVLAQTMLVLASLILLGIHDPKTELGALTVACTLMNCFAAMQDVAVDGMAITVFRDDERGTATGFMVAGQVAGYSFTGWLCVVLLNDFGIPATGLLTACSVGAVGTIALLFRERPGERLLPWSRGEAHPEAPKPERRTGHLFLTLARLFVLPMGLVLVGVEASYRMLEGISLVWHPKIAIRDLGFSDEDYAKWVSIGSVTSAVVGLAMGLLIDRIGQKRGIIIGLASNAALYAILYFVSPSLKDPVFAAIMLTAVQLGSQWMFISTVSLFMKICGVRVAATQFSIYMALSNLAKSFGSKAYPTIEAETGPEGMFLFVSAVYVFGIVLIAFFDLARHKRTLVQLGEA